jgi:hypothetical protein
MAVTLMEASDERVAYQGRKYGGHHGIQLVDMGNRDVESRCFSSVKQLRTIVSLRAYLLLHVKSGGLSPYFLLRFAYLERVASGVDAEISLRRIGRMLS